MQLPPHEPVPGFAERGFTAFTTTRQAGSFNLASTEPASAVFGRWMELVNALAPDVTRVATSLQLHGDRIIEHRDTWSGWLRDTTGADGHVTSATGTAMAVTIADCVPIFIAHPAGTGAILHSGWKGTASRIIAKGLDAFARRGHRLTDVLVHLGPSICGRCYEVGADVYHAVTGNTIEGPRLLDLREVIAGQVRAAGAEVSISGWCTRCHNERFFSHRSGDDGRQLGVLVRGRHVGRGT